MAEPRPATDEDLAGLAAMSLDGWEYALLAARVFAVGRQRIGGIRLRCRASAVRALWLEHVRQICGECKWVKITPQVTRARLCGGLDIAATTRALRPVPQTGLLAVADGGILIIGLAEKLEAGTAALISHSMDTGTCANTALASDNRQTSFAVIALDEGMDESEGLPASLADRLAMTVDLNAVAYHHAVDVAAKLQGPALPTWQTCSAIQIPDELVSLFAQLTGAIGTGSVRSLFHLTDTARILAGLDGKTSVSAEHAAIALRLCLGLRLKAPREETEPPPPLEEQKPEKMQDNPASHADEPETEPPPSEEKPLGIDIDQLREMLVEAQKTGPLADIDLATLGSTRDSRAASGKSGRTRTGARRGRPIGLATSPPFPDARPDIAATIRTAAPWQRLRRQVDGEPASGNIIRPSDFRYKRFKHSTRSAAIFAVDASGSTALERLGETKGAIEMLFASCYVRRDEVALITFRGTGAETVLEPTRSLVRAKRMLSQMAGGGPTPLALGIRQAFQTSLNVRRAGFTPILILLTDGSANIDLEGNPGRSAATSDAQKMALQVAAAGIKSVCIDVSRRPRDSVLHYAQLMGGDYCALPNANAASMSTLVNSYMEAPAP